MLQIPTPRWTRFDALRVSLPLPPEAVKDAAARERACSPPIGLVREAAKTP